MGTHTVHDEALNWANNVISQSFFWNLTKHNEVKSVKINTSEVA